jgi:hypothetical protein
LPTHRICGPGVQRAGLSARGDLEREPSRSEIGALAQELTVGETYFFRNHEQFQALAEVVLPARVRARGAVEGGGQIRRQSVPPRPSVDNGKNASNSKY